MSNCCEVLDAIPESSQEITVLIVAGQSNMINWHADASQLPYFSGDRSVLFYYLTGAPEDRGFDIPMNSTSNGRWEYLSSQCQDPFVRYSRVFFGPEIILARTIKRNTQNPLAILKIGFFGTNLAEDWHPDAGHGNRLYHRLLKESAAALDQLGRKHGRWRLAGFFWIQGETDAARQNHAAQYEHHLKTFIRKVREDFQESNLPFVLSELGQLPKNRYPYYQAVNIAQQKVSSSMHNVSVVSVRGLERDTDEVHFKAKGVIDLGRRMAESWMALQESLTEGPNRIFHQTVSSRNQRILIAGPSKKHEE